MKYAFSVVLVLLCICAASVAVAKDAGAGAGDTDGSAHVDRAADNPVSTVGQIIKDARAGKWRYVFGASIALLMWGFRNARKRTKWFASKRGGAVAALLTTAGLTAVGVLLSGVPITASLIWTTLGGWTTAVGLWHLGKSIIKPSPAGDGS